MSILNRIFGNKENSDMRKLFLILIFALLPLTIFAQSNTNQQTSTTFPQNGKFEIITNSVAFRYTFMLNRETGDTWQYVTTDSGYAWDRIYRDKNDDDKIPSEYTGAVYQITMSGITGKGIFLSNTLTGATWTLYSDSLTGLLFWGTVDSPK